MNITNNISEWNNFASLDECKYTYISENSGYFKIGQSEKPVQRGSKFGTICFIAKNSILEKMLFGYFGKCGKIPYILTISEFSQEWVKVDKQVLLDKAIEYCEALDIQYMCGDMEDSLLITIGTKLNKPKITSKFIHTHLNIDDYNDMLIAIKKLNISEQEFLEFAIKNQSNRINKLNNNIQGV